MADWQIAKVHFKHRLLDGTIDEQLPTVELKIFFTYVNSFTKHNIYNYMQKRCTMRMKRRSKNFVRASLKCNH